MWRRSAFSLVRISEVQIGDKLTLTLSSFPLGAPLTVSEIVLISSTKTGSRMEE